MFKKSVEQARDLYARGRYAEALRLIATLTPSAKREAEELRCLTCECLQFSGDFSTALRQAEKALEDDPKPNLAARYWTVVGRIKLDQHEREQAAEAFRKALRAAERSAHPERFAETRQLLLIAGAENLGTGLLPAVREAYKSAVRTADAATLAGFHLRLTKLEAQRGAFQQSAHHLALAESLLGRSDQVALTALFHVNKACLLTLLGKFDDARRHGELGANLADQAGHVRLAMAAAATVAHAAVCVGELSVAQSWLSKAQALVARLGVVEVGLLETLASLALLEGNLDVAEDHLSKARSVFDVQGPHWASISAYWLLTEGYLHKRRGNREQLERVLASVQAISKTQHDDHSALLATVGEIELLFEDENYEEADRRLLHALTTFPVETAHLGDLERMRARSLWIRGHKDSASRVLLRAAAIGEKSSPRWRWAEALAEARVVARQHPAAAAYSLDDQVSTVERKFPSLTQKAGESWFERTSSPEAKPLEPIDGFEEAISLLNLGGDLELRGREALASLVGLGIVTNAALVLHADAGLSLLASSGWRRSDVQAALRRRTAIQIEIGRTNGQLLELVVGARPDLRSQSAVRGLRRLLEAASAVESQKKHQQRMGALWQPEDIVEEPGAVFSSSKMIELMLTARKVAGTRLPVLLLGPTGTGKEIIARAIHRASPRANNLFLAFNCSAVPRDMVESQLFGYGRGSFTGATDDFPGIIRAAEGGTLFLDEIGELSYDLQPKLLRFLETSEVHPLGSQVPIKVDVRIVAATNANLDDLIDRKAFREDLYYRLNIVRFHLPSLAERREEIPALVTHLLRETQIEAQKHGIKVSDEVMEYLLLYKWPGNIRQLVNELRRMVALVDNNDTLMAEHLTPAIRRTRRTIPVNADPVAAKAPAAAAAKAATSAPAAAAASPTAAAPAPPAPPNSLNVPLEQPLHNAVDALERAMIEHAIARSGGKVEEAARLLGISRKGLFLKRRRWTGGDDTPSDDR